MKHIMKTLWFKTAMIMLFFITLAILFISTVGVIFLIDSEAYVDNGRNLENQALDAAAQDYEIRLHEFADNLYYNGYIDEQEFNDTFGETYCNYFFKLSDQNGKVLLTNYTPKSALRTYFKSEFWVQQYPTVWNEDNPDTLPKQHELILQDGIRKELTAKDRIYYYKTFASFLVNARYIFILLIPTCILLLITYLIALFCAVGHRKGTDDIVLNTADRIPLECYITILLCIPFSVGLVFDVDSDLAIILILLCGIPCLLALLLTIATRIKTATLFSNTLLYKAGKLLNKALHSLSKVSLYWQIAVIWLGLSFLDFVLLASTDDVFMVVWLLGKVLLTGVLIWITIHLQTLRKGAKAIANGDLTHNIQTTHMLPVLREHAEHLNGIQEGLQTALEKSLKSERMRTELITNVSHDLKTPLTSIINYVDLLKKDGLNSEQAPEYLQALDRQSIRLKKLTEDIIDASKAISGNIPVTISKLDIRIFMEQITAEYEDRFAERSLHIIPQLSDRLPSILADSRLLWRVFDNLFQNIYKYAKSDSRVYITVTPLSHAVLITIKNMSAYELNISPEELTERFVQGDKSRHTEGSGLGLSIAKSLTELQHGTFEIAIDGDLFKTMIRLQAVE